MRLSRPVLLLLISTLCLSACGFRLAGTADLPPQLATIHLKAEAFDERQRKALQRTLEAAGAELVAQADTQAARLSVVLNSQPDLQLATSSNSGEIVRRLVRTLDYSVKDASGNFIVSPRTLKQQNDITLDENNLLASNRERESVVRELEQALYDQLVRQLAGR